MTADNLRAHLASLLVLAVGVFGLIHDTFHVLFGVMLWVYIVAGFYRRIRQPQPMLPGEMSALVRDLSRRVYLVLYILMFFRIAIGILRAAPQRPIFTAAEDFQSYLICGLIALATIHVLAALCRHFAIRGGAAPLRHLSPKRPADVA